MEKEIRIGSGAPWESQVGYSRAVRKGNMIWVSGTTAIQNDAVIGIGDPYLQARTCLKIIETALQDLGAQLQDVVRTRIYVTNIAQGEEIGRAHGEFFREIKPCATLVEVRALIRPEILVEIEAEAMV